MRGLSRLRSEGEPLRRRRLARDWGDAASQVRLMVHMADKRRHEEKEKGGKQLPQATSSVHFGTDGFRSLDSEPSALDLWLI